MSNDADVLVEFLSYGRAGSGPLNLNRDSLSSRVALRNIEFAWFLRTNSDPMSPGLSDQEEDAQTLTTFGESIVRLMNRLLTDGAETAIFIDRSARPLRYLLTYTARQLGVGSTLPRFDSVQSFARGRDANPDLEAQFTPREINVSLLRSNLGYLTKTQRCLVIDEVCDSGRNLQAATTQLRAAFPRVDFAPISALGTRFDLRASWRDQGEVHHLDGSTTLTKLGLEAPRGDAVRCATFPTRREQLRVEDFDPVQLRDNIDGYRAMLRACKCFADELSACVECDRTLIPHASRTGLDLGRSI